jgi:hypothetical protein
MERFNVKKLNVGEVEEQYQVTMRNKFAALENLESNWGNQQGMERYWRKQNLQP